MYRAERTCRQIISRETDTLKCRYKAITMSFINIQRSKRLKDILIHCIMVLIFVSTIFVYVMGISNRCEVAAKLHTKEKINAEIIFLTKFNSLRNRTFILA